MADEAGGTVVARQLQAGQVIFREGDPGTIMYVIREGRVKIFREHMDGDLVLAFLEAGDFFGEMALLEGLPRSASASVVEPSTLIEVDARTFEEMIRRNIEIAVRIMRKLAGRVRSLDERLARMTSDNSAERVLEVLRWLMPQGTLDGDWIRIANVVDQLDLAAQAGVRAEHGPAVIQSMCKAGCMAIDNNDLLIASAETLDAYGTYLALQRKYGSSYASETSPMQERRKAIRRLLGALQLTPQEVDTHQESLAGQYERYRHLRSQFAGWEDDRK